MTSASSRFSGFLWPCAIAAACVALYLPFAGNPLVFDDRLFFSGRNFAHYATTPLGLELRLPAYFSLAFVEMVWGGVRGHRLVSLLLHATVALVLYKIILELLRQAAPQAPARLAAFVAAAAFAVHPVAVYGAAYLAQRTGLLATLFSLVSVALFARGAVRRSHADAVSAALLYALAVLSKETAVLVPAAALAVLAVVRPGMGFAVRHGALYAALCAPAAVLVTLLVKGKIGTAYEPDFAGVASQAASAGAAAESPWAMSALTQLELYFRYLALWLWPDTSAMSIDLRVDLGGGMGWLAAFIAAGAACAWMLARGGRWALAGFGLAWFWVLFLVELTTVRFAEPFVLYRSYLWAPGLAIALAAAIPDRRAARIAALVALPILAFQAHDRLHSFSSGLVLWQDAAGKLPAGPVPGGSRTLYQLGREQLYAGEPENAVATIERCLAQYPDTYDCTMARAAIHIELGRHEDALPHLRRAAELRPELGGPAYLRGIVLENTGRIDEARTSYQQAAKLGSAAAIFRLQRLDQPGKGLLAPTRSAKPPPD